MKKFDLEKALAGEPVRLRDGSKAFVMFRKPKELVFTHDTELVGYVISKNIHAITESWSINGLYQENEESDADIVGMWEEPPPTVTLTLPCPLKELEEGQKFWHITMNSDPLGIAWAKVDVGMSVFDKENVYHLALLDAGLAFKSEEDAQTWLDAMRDARR